MGARRQREASRRENAVLDRLNEVGSLMSACVASAAQGPSRTDPPRESGHAQVRYRPAEHQTRRNAAPPDVYQYAAGIVIDGRVAARSGRYRPRRAPTLTGFPEGRGGSRCACTSVPSRHGTDGRPQVRGLWTQIRSCTWRSTQSVVVTVSSPSRTRDCPSSSHLLLSSVYL